jgi:hypothetical protein
MVWFLIIMVLPFVALAYVGWHLWLLLPLSAVWKALIIVALLAAFLLLFAVLGRKLDSLPLPLAQTVYEIGTSALIVLLYLVILFLLFDIAVLGCAVIRRCGGTWELGYEATWRGTALVAALITALLVYGNLNYRHKHRHTLTLTTDKPITRPYRLVMASDLHLGYHNTRRELARWVDLFNAEHADAILLAGDLVDGSMRPLLEEDMAAELRRLNAPVYACLGNHEFYSGLPEAERFYRDANIRLLRDDTARIAPSLIVIGRDDRTNHRRAPLSTLFLVGHASQRDSSAIVGHASQRGSTESTVLGSSSDFLILLDHQPYHLEQAERAGIDLQLSGHTHRGQIWPLSWITDALYECSWGSHQRGRTHYYISSGLGIWGGKFRIGTRSEYVVITINPSKQ